ncbi:cell wall integrity and stress response component 3-like isoform X2 [Stylophora pistillata]|uniref:cell wall integrity and stress response component 3-like isoform X2 n=1 Tax=Stylophora pistillata TaxID=50429 RepID=UPI000C044BED|nr:cell wall integrity and stress response component 3-like isoform X2 [Stylophora pistillata]
MTFPHRLKFALFLICCMQHAHGTSVIGSNTAVYASLTEAIMTQPMTKPMTKHHVTSATYIATKVTTTTNTAVNASLTEPIMTQPMTKPMTKHHVTSATYIATKVTTTNATPSIMVEYSTKTSGGGPYNTGPPMATIIAFPTAKVALTSTTHNATNLSSAHAHITSTPVTTSTSVTNMRNVSFSIGSGTEYSSPDCISCSNGGTITVTMSCSIKIKGSDDKKCDEDKFNGTLCDYVTLANKMYSCAEVKQNFTYYEKEHLKSVKECKVVCPASSSVLCPHIVFIFASGLVVGMLSQSL